MTFGVFLQVERTIKTRRLASGGSGVHYAVWNERATRCSAATYSGEDITFTSTATATAKQDTANRSHGTERFKRLTPILSQLSLTLTTE